MNVDLVKSDSRHQLKSALLNQSPIWEYCGNDSDIEA